MLNITIYRGDTATIGAFIGPAGSLAFDTELNQLYLQDGITAGGHLAVDIQPFNDLKDQVDGLNIEFFDGLDAAIALKLSTDQIGVSSGVAGLDGDGKIPESQLPTFVNEVLEYADFESLPAVGDAGKLYVSVASNRLWRWSGSLYIEIAAQSSDTDELAEGLTAQYITIDRVRDAFSSGGDVTYDPETGVLGLEVPEVTVGDIGLDQVENLPMATEQQAIDADTNAAYMGPLGTAQFAGGIGFVKGDNGWVLDQSLLPFPEEVSALSDFSYQTDDGYVYEGPDFEYGTTAENDSWTREEGVITIDTDKENIRIHDGVTAGGYELPDVE